MAQIIGYPQSTHVRTALLTAAHHGIAVENVMPDMEAPDYPHPFGKMPVLRDDGFVLFETIAIVRYLDAKAGGGLVPKDLWKAALVAQWQSVADDYVYHDAIKGYAFEEKRPDPASFRKQIDVIERALTGKFLVGDSVTLADYAMAPCLDYLSHNAPELLAGLPRIAAYLDRMRATEAWVRSEPVAA